MSMAHCLILKINNVKGPSVSLWVFPFSTHNWKNWTVNQAAKTAVEQVIIDHRTTLRYLGVPLGVVNGSDASWMFGDNLSVVNSTVMPNGKLQKRSHLLNYHICRAAQASGIINFAHIDGKDNPADILTKNRSSKEDVRV